MSDKMWKEPGRLYTGIGRSPNKLAKKHIPPGSTGAGNPPSAPATPSSTAPAEQAYPNISADAKTIKTYSGIGDLIWMMMKLSTLNEKFNWIISADAPQRGHQVFEILPQFSASTNYATNFHSNIALINNIQEKSNTWEQIRNQKEFFLTISQHFEAQPAKNLKDWLPDLGINYYLPYITTEFESQANEMLSDNSKKYIICYGASYFSAKAWGFWGAESWFDFIKKLKMNDDSIVPVIVGASWDTDMTMRLMEFLITAQIPFVKLIGEKLGLVVEIMKRVKYGFYFPSGLGVIAGTLGAPALMWYPQHLETMPGTWCDPFLTQVDIFHETKFCTPDETIAYIDKRGGF